MSSKESASSMKSSHSSELVNEARSMVNRMLGHGSIAKAMKFYETKREQHGLDPKIIAKEYCEFLVLKIRSGDFSASESKLSPGGVIDEFWHGHILDTVGYR